MEKRCRKCGLQKLISEFHRSRQASGQRSSRGGGGVEAVCKQCRAEKRAPGITARREIYYELVNSGLKRCGLCDEWKPRVEFSKRTASSDGLAFRCRPCVKQVSHEWRLVNPGAFKVWYQANKVSRAEYWKTWYQDHKEERAISFAAWARKNKHIVNALLAKRNAVKFKATPSWADRRLIWVVYAESVRLTQETGIKHEVDHIYPLQGKTVCGLHCEANLQILMKADNIRKHNRMPEELA